MPQAAAAVLMLVAAAAAAGPAADVSAVNAWVDATKQDAGLIRQLVTSGKTAAASSKLDEVRRSKLAVLFVAMLKRRTQDCPNPAASAYLRRLCLVPQPSRPRYPPRAAFQAGSRL